MSHPYLKARLSERSTAAQAASLVLVSMGYAISPECVDGVLAAAIGLANAIGIALPDGALSKRLRD